MTPAQQILAKLLISNELLNEKQCAQVFQQVADPEEALTRLVKAGRLTDRIGTQLLTMLRQQLDKLAKANAGAAPTGEIAGQGVSSSGASVAPGKTTADAASGAGTTPAAGEVKTDAPSASTDASATKPVPAASVATSGKTSEKPASHITVHTNEAPDPAGKKLIHEILKMARERGASDVHITAGLPPVFRINTRLVEVEMGPLSPETTRTALLSLLDDDRRKHFIEHSDIDFCYDGGAELGRFRTNFLIEQNGADGVFRLISPTVPSLDELGMPEIVKKFTTYAVGIVLITGPKGCGKTTTLSSMVDLINSTRADHVITIEDPIEFVHKCKKGHVNQREVGTHTKSFSNALRAALREAPNVIMVGEMRDLETTSLAVSAAETGHLVLATLHTPDAIRTIGRVLDVFPPKEQGQIRGMLSESLRGVVSQQLAPSKDGSELHLAIEILVNTSAIGNLIREDRAYQLRGAMQTGRRLGMVLMDDSLLKLVGEGKIDPQEAVARASDPEYVTREIPKIIQAKKGK